MKKSTFVFWIITVWLIVSLWAAYVYIHSRITFPTAEGYEKDWLFQLEMFSLFRLPLLLVVLFVVLWLSRRWTK